ncbi:hypothetical protein ACQPW3_17685 [Actinosynnema sp. CA-248983]
MARKIDVDQHEQHKAAIAEAVWRLVARSGLVLRSGLVARSGWRR